MNRYSVTVFRATRNPARFVVDALDGAHAACIGWLRATDNHYTPLVDPQGLDHYVVDGLHVWASPHE
ncbi:MAG TPA: hypothetical protein VMS04_11105 [Vicinamibacterales bacterium]|jgi:hypothetical protein|nr:hypothetical protein [Vicinamibacterales bacterium]